MKATVASHTLLPQDGDTFHADSIGHIDDLPVLAG